MNIQESSHAFEPGDAIPKEHTGEGRDVSPPLAWSGLPEGTRELALVCDDPDAPTSKPFVHWVLYKIPRGPDLSILRAVRGVDEDPYRHGDHKQSEAASEEHLRDAIPEADTQPSPEHSTQDQGRETP
jgi:Raf kinase inhibitor-like YbhB/YbcL family protein